MEIKYLGHASFRIKGKDASVVTDPFTPKMVGFPFPKVSAEIVTVSHQHEDHNQEDLVGGEKKVLKGPGEYEIMGISFIGISSYHDDSKGAERGENIIFVIEVDGFRIAHLGDLGHVLSESTVDRMGDIDVLMIPVGGEYTIGPKEAVEVTKQLGPKVVIPMHYKTSDHNPEVFSKMTGVEEFVSQLGVKSEEMPKFSLKAGSLLPEEDQRVVILSRS